MSSLEVPWGASLPVVWILVTVETTERKEVRGEPWAGRGAEDSDPFWLLSLRMLPSHPHKAENAATDLTKPLDSAHEETDP